MDTELARTFLEIVSTGSFVHAAERLHVGQTTVSARIRLLEERLGRQLFVRNRNGATLTPAGEQFLRHAPLFVQLWHRVRNQMAVPPGHTAVLTIGGEVNLWHPLMINWIGWMRQHQPRTALRAHVDVPQDLINLVAEGLIDVALLYAPPHRPGLKIDLLLEDRLVMVSTLPQSLAEAHESHVATDWGPDFAREYAASFPNAQSASLSINVGAMGLAYILEAGGSGYFRMRVVEPLLASGRLHRIADAPEIAYPIYIVRSVDGDEELAAPAVAGLREVVAGRLNWVDEHAAVTKA